MGLKRAEADLIFRRVGITFAVYGDDLGAERTIPFDQVPRIFTAKEWEQLEAGLRQRVKALNRFIYDVYHDEEIIKAELFQPSKFITTHNIVLRCATSVCHVTSMRKLLGSISYALVKASSTY
ncbi:hypothetical protein PKF022_05870 [Polynucleobacter sp. KF022]|nr:hypothetical protein PKF022_05870 [Polynucleobacter sp. KF022]